MVAARRSGGESLRRGPQDGQDLLQFAGARHEELRPPSLSPSPSAGAPDPAIMSACAGATMPAMPSCL